MGRPAFPSVVIENVQPLLDGGRYPIKRIVGEDLVVEADIFKDGHDVVAAVLKWRVLSKPAWRETPMIFVDNDRWRGVCTLYDEDIHEYTVEAWTDTFRSWQQEFIKKFEGGISDLRSEALEGAAIVGAAVRRAGGADGDVSGPIECGAVRSGSARCCRSLGGVVRGVV